MSGSEGVPEALAVAVFRGTKRVAKVEEGWLIELSSKSAAESAMRPIGPLKSGFGPKARAQIVSRKLSLFTRIQGTSDSKESSASNWKKSSKAGKSHPQAHWKNLCFKANTAAEENRSAAHPAIGDIDVVMQEQTVTMPLRSERHEVVQAQANPNPVAAKIEEAQPFHARQPFGEPEGDPMMD